MRSDDLLAEKNASIFRESVGLSGNEPIRFKSLLQQLNVITVFNRLSADFSGMAIKGEKSTGDYNKFILVNSNQSLGKQHFTICHELYHLQIQKNFTSQICTVGLYNKQEDKNELYADLFASYLLLPTEGIKKNIPDVELKSKRVSLNTILYIEQFYSSSRQALLFRLKKLGLIDTATYEAYRTNVKRSALENGYPIDIYNPGNDNLVIGDYGTIAKNLFDREKISQSHYYSLLKDLGIDLSQAENGNDAEY